MFIITLMPCAVAAYVSAISCKFRVFWCFLNDGMSYWFRVVLLEADESSLGHNAENCSHFKVLIYLRLKVVPRNCWHKCSSKSSWHGNAVRIALLSRMGPITGHVLYCLYSESVIASSSLISIGPMGATGAVIGKGLDVEQHCHLRWIMGNNLVVYTHLGKHFNFVKTTEALCTSRIRVLRWNFRFSV